MLNCHSFAMINNFRYFVCKPISAHIQCVWSCHSIIFGIVPMFSTTIKPPTVCIFTVYHCMNYISFHLILSRTNFSYFHFLLNPCQHQHAIVVKLSRSKYQRQYLFGWYHAIIIVGSNLLSFVWSPFIQLLYNNTIL